LEYEMEYGLVSAAAVCCIRGSHPDVYALNGGPTLTISRRRQRIREPAVRKWKRKWDAGDP
jgi:hypothetical protein